MRSGLKRWLRLSTQAPHLTVFGALVIAVICSFRCSVRYLALYFIVYISDSLWFTWNAQPNLSIRLFVLLYPDFILRIGEKNFNEYDSGEFYEKKLTTHCNLRLDQIIIIVNEPRNVSSGRVQTILWSNYSQDKWFSFMFWACEEFHRL
jgi:hypothetical protein